MSRLPHIFLLLTLISASACGESAPVSGFTAALENGKIRLTWTNPDDPDFERVVIRRAEGAPPTDHGAPGTQVYLGVGSTYLDGGLEHGKRYAYAVFARNSAGYYSEPVTAEATCAHVPFTLVVMPDTQYLSLSYFPILNFNTQWIVEQKKKKKRNIAFVLHEGDITHNNTVKEWEVASIAMGKLDGEVPFAPNVGNHDMNQGSTGTALFNKYFPLSDFSDRPTFGGSYPAGKMDNSYHLFVAGGADWLIISLAYNPNSEALFWANSVVNKFPQHRVIVVTHAYLAPSGKRSGIGEHVWKELVSPHRSMSLVLNGHYIGGVGSRLVSTGDKGNKVYQMFANYQHAEVSGYGMMRLLKLDRVARTISVSSYAPIKDWALADGVNKFEIKDVDLGPVK